ncbi:hypothetical protein QMK33_19595 [Hymenobacter sp. H14-R3]|uniref:hypothetical protein n=1 Tax=Hymenobacter sp. H14-R3 TaxID=3046308 RepID=UPI0024BBD226|nr:hypothetical protein [Hymenobacter sp. H14-R3]MDJ0367359.1 hypothetical protein [Hymenobacter sp. H14-R3]
MRRIVFLVPALLLAGCRGEQVVFQFQQAPATSVAMAPEIPVTTSATAFPAPTETVAPATVAASPKPTRQLRPHRLADAINTLPTKALSTLSVPTQASRQLSQHLRRRHATEGAAENGLGRVALFFIGVILGVLAGLAALVNLIFSVGFFTALGYTAAGLVVLFLLYSLLSGGKKTSTKPAK